MDKTCFISGHLDLSQEEWDTHYKEPIDKAIEMGCNFIVGDAKGADYISSSYLKERGVSNVIIYHMFEKPRNNPGYCSKGGFKTDTERDEFMTCASGFDIAWVRPKEERIKLYGENYQSERLSGTQRNLDRRKKHNEFLLSNKN